MNQCTLPALPVGYSERVMLLYDGLHYDALAVAAFANAPEELDVTIYDPSSGDAKAIEDAAQQLVRVLCTPESRVYMHKRMCVVASGMVLHSDRY